MEAFTVPSVTRNPKLSMKESNIWIVPESAIVKASNGCWEEWEPTPMQEEYKPYSIQCTKDSLGKGQVTASFQPQQPPGYKPLAFTITHKGL